jgi:hypothetical protein
MEVWWPRSKLVTFPRGEREYDHREGLFQFPIHYHILATDAAPRLNRAALPAEAIPKSVTCPAFEIRDAYRKEKTPREAGLLGSTL